MEKVDEKEIHKQREQKKLLKFNKLIFNGYKKTEQFDKVNFQMNRCREILVKENYLFSRMSAVRQYELCSIIVCMTIHTSMTDMRMFKVFTAGTTDNSDLNYSLTKDYKEPEKIEVSEPKRKLLK